MKLSFTPGLILLLLANTLLSNLTCNAQTAVITVFAGNGGQAAFSGDGGNADTAGIFWPQDLNFNKATGNLYISDWGNERIRVVEAGTHIINTVAGNGNSGYAGDGGPADSALFSTYLWGIATDDSDNIYICDRYNQRIRKVDAITHIINTYAGDGFDTSIGTRWGGFGGDGGRADSARLNYPCGIAVDALRNLYIADEDNNRIRKVTAATGIMSTIAGNGHNNFDNNGGYTGDGGMADTSQLNLPTGVAVDDAGNVYIADTYNNRIRKIDAVTGLMSTVAGNGFDTIINFATYGGFSGDSGLATEAELNLPAAVAVDPDGSNFYIADKYNNRIRQVNTSTGIITTLAGGGTTNYVSQAPATSIYLEQPSGISLDNNGNLYIANSETYIYEVIINPTVCCQPRPSSKVITLFPNPSSGTMNLYISGGGYNSVQVFNQLGQPVYMQALNPDVQVQNVPVSLNNAASGIYTFRVSGKDGVATERGMLQR